MPSDKLTELGINMSKSGIKEKKLYDGQGLCLLLHPNGSKYWRGGWRHYKISLKKGSCFLAIKIPVNATRELI